MTISIDIGGCTTVGWRLQVWSCRLWRWLRRLSEKWTGLRSHSCCEIATTLIHPPRVQTPDRDNNRPAAARLSIRSNHRVLRISRHAKLGNVQAFLFHLWRHSHAFRFVYAPEDSVGRTERPGSVQSCSHELAQELSRITVVQSRHALSSVAEIRRRA